MFNTTRTPTDELAVRQALILGTDRSTIVQTIFGSTSPVAQGPLSLNVMPFLAKDPLPDNDPAEAARLLGSAGWSLEEGQTARSHDGQPMQLKIVAPSWGSNPEVAQLLQAAWERLGIKVEIETAAGFGPLKEAQAAGEYNLIGVNLFGTDPDLLRPFFTTDGTYDWTMIHSGELDRLLLKASQSTQDSASRAALYEQVAGKIREQALILPVRDYVNLVVASARVLDLRFSAQGWFPHLIDLRLAS
jgi:peptide/nickel transport system substrate-binding protein